MHRENQRKERPAHQIEHERQAPQAEEPIDDAPLAALEDRRRIDYGKIERKLGLLYPNSKVYLIPMSRKISSRRGS